MQQSNYGGGFSTGLFLKCSIVSFYCSILFPLKFKKKKKKMLAEPRQLFCSQPASAEQQQPFWKGKGGCLPTPMAIIRRKSVLLKKVLFAISSYQLCPLGQETVAKSGHFTVL